MADATEVITLKDGADTSEFKLARVAVILGGVLELASGVLEQLQNGGLLPAGKAQSGVAVALVVIGGLLQIASVLGYTRSRQALKMTHMQATAAAVIAAAGQEVASVPVVVQPPAPPSPR